MEKLPSKSEVVPTSDATIPLLVVDLRKYICAKGSVSPVSASTTIPLILVRCGASCAPIFTIGKQRNNMYKMLFFKI
jgi:hypothetical protein